MKRLLSVCLSLAALSAASALPAFGKSSPDSALARRVAKLEAKSVAEQRTVTALQTKITALQSKITALTAANTGLKTSMTAAEKRLACMGKVAPLGWYGNPSAGHGYLYTPDGQTVFPTTALDIAPADQTPSFLAVVADAGCAGTSPGAQFSQVRPRAASAPTLQRATRLH